ncbi:Nucleoid occlusion protein [subsurface metagenome]
MTAKKTSKSIYKELRTDLIDRPDEVARLEISEGELSELRESIKEQGLLQPLVVTPRGDRFEIVAGDRRFLAVRSLGWDLVPCAVRKTDEASRVVLRAVENLQRVNLTPIEEAKIFEGLHTKKGMSLTDIGKAVGKARGSVARRILMLEMPDNFQRALHAKQISMTVAEILVDTPDQTRRDYFLEMAIEHGITKVVAKLWVEDERKRLRTEAEPRSGGSPARVALKDTPVYVPCDLCQDPVDIKNAVHLGVCPACLKKLEDLLGVE